MGQHARFRPPLLDRPHRQQGLRDAVLTVRAGKLGPDGRRARKRLPADNPSRACGPRRSGPSRATARQIFSSAVGSSRTSSRGSSLGAAAARGAPSSCAPPRAPRPAPAGLRRGRRALPPRPPPRSTAAAVGVSGIEALLLAAPPQDALAQAAGARDARGRLVALQPRNDAAELRDHRQRFRHGRRLHRRARRRLLHHRFHDGVLYTSMTGMSTMIPLYLVTFRALGASVAAQRTDPARGSPRCPPTTATTLGR